MDEAAFHELGHQWPHAPVEHQFCHNQQRHRYQNAGVRLDIVEERQRDAVAPRAPFHDRQHQQRHPRQPGEHDDAAAQQLQRIAGEAGPPPELIERAPEHQGEFLRFGRLAGVLAITFGVCCSHSRVV